MSIEQVQAFIEKAKKDEKLILKLYAAEKNEDKVKIARQEGFEFTEEELTKERKRFDDPGGKKSDILRGIMNDIGRRSDSNKGHSAQAQAFIEKVKKDEKLILKLYAAVENKDKVEIARQEGFEFTEEELTKERKRFNPGKSHLFQNRCIKKNAGYLLAIMHDIRKSSEGYPTDQKNRLDVLKHEKKLHLIFD